jgi:formate hydrogenlyase subunit 3/multisubunit Na+/H+ antiporter MnhD subunit
MNRLPLLPLAVPLACLALLSLVAFLGVVAIAGALHVVRAVLALCFVLIGLIKTFPPESWTSNNAKCLPSPWN